MKQIVEIRPQDIQVGMLLLVWRAEETDIINGLYTQDEQAQIAALGESIAGVVLGKEFYTSPSHWEVIGIAEALPEDIGGQWKVLYIPIDSNLPEPGGRWFYHFDELAYVLTEGE